MPTSQDEEWAYKMCKKIAQLTKVIYTLNCKNEDNEERTQWLAQQHALEMNRIREQYNVRLEDASRQLQETQGTQAKSLANVQATHSQLLKEAQGEYELRLSKLLVDMERCKGVYDTSLATMREETEARITAETDRVQKAKDEETSNLVREYNERYKAMLAQQLDEKDALEKALTEQWSSKVQSLEAQLSNSQNESAKDLASTTLLLREKEAALKKLDGENHRLLNQVNELTSSSAHLRRQCEELEGRLTAEQRNLADKSKDETAVRAQLDSLERELRVTSDALAAAETSLDELRRKAARLESDCGALENEKELLHTRVKLLEKELQDSAARVESVSTERDQLRSALASLQDASDGNESERQRSLAQIGSLEQRIEELEKAARELAAAHAEKLASLEEAHAEALRRTGAEVQQFGSARVAELEGRIVALESGHAAQLAERERQQSAQHSALTAEHDAIVAKLNAEIDSLRARLSEADAAATRAADEQTTLSADLQRLQTVSGELEQLRQRHGELEATCAEHVSTIRELQMALDKLSSHQSESAESQRAHLEAVQRELEETRHTLTKEHTAQLEAQRAALEARIAAAEKSHTALLENMKAEHVLAMKQMRDACSRDVAASVRSGKEVMEELEANHRKAMAAASVEAEEAARALRERISTLEERLQQAERVSQSRAEDSTRQVTELRQSVANLQDTQRRKDADAAAELARLREELTTNGQAALEAARKQHEMALEKQNQKTQKAADEYAASLEKLTKDSDEHVRLKDERHKQAMKDYGEQLAADKKEVVKSLTAAHEQQMEAQRATSDAAVRALQEQARSAQSAADDWERKYVAMHKECQDAHAATEKEKSAHTASRHEAEQQRTILKQRHDMLMRETQDQHSLQLQRASVEHKAIIDDLMKQHSDEARSLQSVLDQLRAELEEIRHKYLYRESRAEDVDLINQLLKDNKAKEKALAKAYEDMKMYKLELINREESYNKVFGRRPVVADSHSTPAEASKTHLPAIRTSGAAASSRTTSQMYH